MVHIASLAHHRTIHDYATHITNKFVRKHYHSGCNEVIVVFDDPGRFQTTPKALEHQRSYGNMPVSEHRVSTKSTQCTRVERMLKCQVCKRNLTAELTKLILHASCSVLPVNCRFITVGAQEGSHR